LKRRAAVLLAATVVAQVLGAVPSLAPAARGAEFSMVTDATYDVLPLEGHVAVSVDVTFENTTPDPAGQFSLFEEVKLAIHDEAAEVTAEDDAGALTVNVGREGSVNVATVHLRGGLRFEEVATFTLGYRLPDGDDPALRVSPSIVVFSAWGFGTRSAVTVDLPAGYEVQIDGDRLSAEETTAGTRLSSGRITSPGRWLALVSAQRPGSYVTLTETVPLSGGTADLQVRAFSDDEEWGQRTLALVAEALPRMEEAIGLPYPHVGPLIISESFESGVDGFIEGAGTDEVLVAFDQPEFTALHQVAHVWLDPELIEARWIREGFASHVAERIGVAVDVDPPYRPEDERDASAAAAIPLDRWPETLDAERDRYAYAAAWALLNEIAAAVGPGDIERVMQRAAAGIGPYEPFAPDVVEPVGEVVPLTSRAFLDHLEQVSGTPLADVFGELVFDVDDARLLDERNAARDRLGELNDAAGDWGVPGTITGPMAAWRFDRAVGRIDDAISWTEQRDDLLGDMRRVGLSTPQRLRDAYLLHGGGADAVTELAAEAALVDAYGGALVAVNDERSVLARFGLLGGPDPAARLTDANGSFADGDLRAAADAIAEAERQLAGAEAQGLLRLGSLGVAILLLMAIVIVLIRRRRVTATRA
jgi:hypothetical protein